MFRILFILFLSVPLLEIYLLIQVGGIIGAWPTVFLVVFTAVLGAVLLRHQGLFTLNKVQTAMARGEIPTLAMLEGVVLILCGALLLTPGFFTDALGFLGLVPPLRQALISAVLARGVVSAVGGAYNQRHPHSHQDGQNTLEGEYRREDD
ncbi:MAG: FxsA family protein [Pseudomonadota bacterium]